MAENRNSFSQDILTEAKNLNLPKKELDLIERLKNPQDDPKFYSQLLLDSISLVAEGHEGNKIYDSAIIYFNKGRIISPATEKFFDGFVNNYILFYENYKNVCSVQDLNKLYQPFERILNYHEVNHNDHEHMLRRGRDLLIKINYRIKYNAKKAIETPATHKIDRIYNALYSDMSVSEIQAEFARIIEDDIREIVDKKRKKKHKKKQKDTPKEK